MSYSLRANSVRIISACFVVVLVITTFNLSVDSSVSAVREKQEKIAADIEKFEKNLKLYETQAHEYKLQTIDLEQQLGSLDGEIAEVESTIGQIDEVLSELSKEEELLQAESAVLQEQMISLLREYQKVSRISPIQVFLTSGNFSEALSTLNNYSSLEARAQDIQIELDKKQEQISINKERNERAIKSLQDSKIFLDIKKQEKEIILVRTQGKQEEFEAIVRDHSAKIKEFEDAANKAQKEFEEAQAAERAAEAARQRQQQNSSSGSSSSSGGGGSTVVGCFFQESRALNIPAGYFGRPTNGYVTQSFHCRHDALDIGARSGTALTSIADGTVVEKSFMSGGYGYYVVVRHNLPSGQRVYSLYAHMNSPSPLGIGTVVTKGQTIGYMGCTGLCTGPHVHFVIMSDTYERGGVGCRWNTYGGTKCYNPRQYINI